MTEPLASFTTPTLNRPETHEALYGTFAAQTYEPKLLHVYDESAAASPLFSKLRDPRVDYVHAPMKDKREVTRIGAARNILCQRAYNSGATFILALDDDDNYAPAWCETMIAKLGDADLAKLAVFRLLVTSGEAAGTLWQWDIRRMGGKHWGLKGKERPESTEIGANEDPAYAHAMRYGFMFSWCWRSSLSQRFKFPEEGTEDYPWLRECMENGARVVEVDDYAEGCLHAVSPDSPSMCWPQLPLSPGFAGTPRTLRDLVRWRMLGAIPAMHELPQQDFVAEPGVTYQIVAQIKKNHTLKSVTTRASSWGLTISGARDNVDSGEFSVAAAPDGYRLVQMMGQSSKRVKVPWKTNKLVSAFDKSRIVRAWSDKPMHQINGQFTPAAGVAGLAHGFGNPPSEECDCKHNWWNAQWHGLHRPGCTVPKTDCTFEISKRCYQLNGQISPR